MRKRMVVALLLCVSLSMRTFAQTSNATLGGTVSDATGALIPGVTVTITQYPSGLPALSANRDAFGNITGTFTPIGPAVTDANGYYRSHLDIAVCLPPVREEIAVGFSPADAAHMWELWNGVSV